MRIGGVGHRVYRGLSALGDDPPVYVAIMEAALCAGRETVETWLEKGSA